MPWNDPDRTDPMELVGVSVPGDEESLRDMAWAFAEELARDGRDSREILAIFGDASYAGPHLAWRTLGEPEVCGIVAECVHVLGRRGEPCPR